MILFYVILALLGLAAALNWKRDRSTSVLFLLLGALWIGFYLVFGVAPPNMVD